MAAGNGTAAGVAPMLSSLAIIRDLLAMCLCRSLQTHLLKGEFPDGGRFGCTWGP